MIPGAATRVLELGELAFTAYEVGQGPLVLCLHGFPDTPATWRLLLPDLARAGYRAVAVTSRGYEPSSQPANGDYSLAALSDDVLGWMQALGEDDAHLVGHDWGSSIAHAVAAKAPDRVRSLTALAVPHPAGFAAAVATDLEQLERSWYVFFFLSGALADAVVGHPDGAFLERLWRKWSPGWTPPAEDLAAVRAAFARPGVTAAALSYYRTAFDPLAPRAAETQALWANPIQAPVHGLAGVADGCISASGFETAMAPIYFRAPPRLRVLERVGHFLHLEDPARVNEAILNGLAEATSSARG